MPDDVEANGGEVSDAMSDNDYDDHDFESYLKDEDQDHDHDNDNDQDDKMAEHQNNEAGQENAGEGKKKYDPKDPSRPRRKKARRACFACQRAHLTCGDERPCQRCIKRGLADQCQDGVRKKAKYLHDAPPEALRPVLGPNYNPSGATSTPTRPANGGRHPSSTASDVSTTPGSFFASTTSTGGYPVFSGGGQTPVAMPDQLAFAAQVAQVSPVSPTFQGPQVPTEAPGGFPGAAAIAAAVGAGNPFYEQLLAAAGAGGNPGLLNFDLEGLNFGSHYGALEFGMLGAMASGTAETPPRDPSSLSQQGGEGGAGFGPGGVYGNGVGGYGHVFDGSNLLDNFMGLDQSNGLYGQGNLQHGLPHAYAIAAGPTSLASPSTENTSSPQPSSFTFDGSPTNNYAAGAQPPNQQRPRPKQLPPAKFGPQSILGKRQRDPSYIYESIKEPYAYRSGFHKLIALLKGRFSPTKTVRIAKSLASIRPSFISCTMTLNSRDLVFMEKCFQRTLFEYEDFMLHTSAPTIVCRRTGEVAAVNKEFTALTGWTRDVLLGKAPNFNVNTGGQGGGGNQTSSGPNTGLAGLATPRLKGMTEEAAGGGPADDSGPQPVFIPEFMDDDSVIEFYEDYAQLAFNDSRGQVTRKCRLLKYRTKESLETSGASASGSLDEPQQQQQQSQQLKDIRASILSNRVTKIDGEHGISKIEKDGKVDCTYCWTIKRDVFNIPMLIVMNFLPCYYRNQEPHQLVV